MSIFYTIPAGEVKYLTVDVKTLHANQLLHKQDPGGDTRGKGAVWIQVGGDKQNRINCYSVIFHGPGKMVYGHPRLCGAMVYVETAAELEYET